jgi:two-component system NarL family response regulator
MKEVLLQKTSPVKILIADDHPVVREGLVALINRRPDMVVVAEASNGREAVAEFLLHRPDVALIDLRMPEMDGVDAIMAIREKAPSARAIVLTTYDDGEDIQRALRAGAKAYLLKDAPREELLACIHAVHEGRTLIPPAIAAKLADLVGA